MKKRFVLISIVLFSLVAGNCFAVGPTHPQLKAFAPAIGGLERFVIALPHKERREEDTFKVEIIPGKKLLTDGVNTVRIGLAIVPKPLEGWGYTYYEVSGSDSVMSTMMAVPEGQKNTEQFVSGTPLLIRYNSRLPIVIYCPEGVEVRYRIWQTSPDFDGAPKG